MFIVFGLIAYGWVVSAALVVRYGYDNIFWVLDSVAEIIRLEWMFRR